MCCCGEAAKSKQPTNWAVGAASADTSLTYIYLSDSCAMVFHQLKSHLVNNLIVAAC